MDEGPLDGLIVVLMIIGAGLMLALASMAFN